MTLELLYGNSFMITKNKVVARLKLNSCSSGSFHPPLPLARISPGSESSV